MRILLPVLVALGATLAAGCGSRARDGHGPAASVAEVRVLVAGDRAPSPVLVLPGRVRARDEVSLTARVAGRVSVLRVREGDRFRRGQSLARFDEPEAREALAAARAAHEAASLALGKTRRQLARMDSLHARRVLSDRELELAQVDARSAEAGEAAARAALERWTESVTLPAPFDGVVSKRFVDPGQSVQPGEPLLELRSLDVGEIEAAVPESRLEALEGARLAVQVGEGAWRPARLARIEGTTDPSTRTRLARFRVDDRHGLEAGGYARVRIEASAGDAVVAAARPLAVPESSVVRRGALTGVFVVRDGRARLRWLRTGRESAAGVEVLAGLLPGDSVIAGASGLEDGRPVRVMP
jgi:RND family efflux transporter MFP subunit